jgi:hypothetical protein
MKSNIFGGILACLSSIVLFRLVASVFELANYALLAQSSLDVTTGHPRFKMWQSRVLGPYIIKVLTFGSLDYVKAHILFQIVAVAVAAFLCWRLGRKYGGSDQSALLALTLFVMCFALLLSPPWLYSWDLIDIIVVILFIDLVLSGKSLRWFVGLFAIAVFNRDSAILIALWLIIDPLIRFLYQRQHKLSVPLDWHRILAGAICIGVGFLVVELLKQSLLVAAIYPEDIYLNRIPDNIYFLKRFVTHLTRESLFVVPVLWVMVTALWACLVRRDPQRYLGLYLIVLSYMTLLFVFSNIDETRMHLFLIPFVVASAVLLSRQSASVCPETY